MTDAEKILEYLQKGNTITMMDAMRVFGTVSLRERIRDIREKGFNIQTKSVTNPQTKRRHAVYYLAQEKECA